MVEQVAETVNPKNVSDLVDIFNSLFEGSAKAAVGDNRLGITVGSETIIIALPDLAVVGVQSRGSRRHF